MHAPSTTRCDMKGHIHSFESFGTVDGPGVRFVVFFAGCPMRCRYCHNPDTWDPCGKYEESAEEVLSRMLRNRPFYKTGGLTATGGEPLLQLPFLTALFSLAKKNGIHTALDTSGILFREDPETLCAYDRLLDATDLLMLDIKHIRDGAHRDLTGHGNHAPLALASYAAGRGVPLRIRYVLVPGLTDDPADLRALGEFLAPLRGSLEKLEILPYHRLGEFKYEKLGIPYPLAGVREPTADEVAAAYDTVTAAMERTA